MTTTATEAGLAVELTDLTRVYGSVRALDGLTLHLAPGELVALLGPSGCGKTTALRILAGLDQATSGSVEVGGKDLTRVPANKRDMGMVFQAYSLFPHLTVIDNVAFGLKLRGRDGAARRKRAGDMLDLVGLGEHADRYAHQLSGGQQQRVALARAVVTEPSLLLLDEPLSNLDTNLRESMRNDIRALQKKLGLTAVLVTHDIEEALSVSDRIAVIKSGRIEQVGTPTEIYESPMTQFVASFVGQPNLCEIVATECAAGKARVTVASAFDAWLTTPDRWEPGDSGWLMVRPHRISVLGPDERRDNTFDAVVSSVAYLGNAYELRATINGVPVRVSAATTEQAAPEAGRHIRLGWNASEARAVRHA